MNSSANREGNPEIDLIVDILAGASRTVDFGSVSGSGNIFANGEGEDAIVFISGESYTVHCGDEDLGSETFQVDGGPEPTVAPIEPTTGPAPTEVRPEPTGQVPGGGMGKVGAGGLVTGASVPWGTMGLAASGLLAAGYAVIRRR